MIWSSDLTVKPPHSTECFGCHQGCAYADLGPSNKLVTAWIALSDSFVENGCVRMLSRSHRLGVLSHEAEQRTADRNLVLGQTVSPEAMAEIKDVVRTDGSRYVIEVDGIEFLYELMAGQASHHGWRTIHSSDQPRLGLAVSYMCGY